MFYRSAATQQLKFKAGNGSASQAWTTGAVQGPFNKINMILVISKYLHAVNKVWL